MTISKGEDLKHLVVGSLPPPIGGTSVSFLELINGLIAESVQLEVIQTNNIRGASPLKFIIGIVSVIFNIIRKLRKVDSVSLHLSYKAHLIISPIIVFAAKLLSKKVILRRFGGVLHAEMSWYERVTLNVLCKLSNFYLVETQRQMRELKKYSNVIYYPTGRKKSNYKQSYSSNNELKKIVFVSQVKKEKGIFELISAVIQFEGVELKIYGPLFDGIQKCELETNKRIKYCGIIESKYVANVINEADCVALPSYYSGEGYPGIIFESIHCGKPVILSDWKALPDLLFGNSGVLVQPKSKESIIEGIEKLKYIINKNDFKGDIEKLSNKFDSDNLIKQFVKLL